MEKLKQHYEKIVLGALLLGFVLALVYLLQMVDSARKVTAEDINKCYSKNSIKVLAGCAPCQPFSQMSFKYQNDERTKRENDKRYDLLLEFGRLVKEVQPDIVSMENVPKIRETYVFEEFLKILKDNGYSVDYRSYIEYECEKAVEAGIKIVVLYNSTTVDKSKCPDVLKYQGKHIPMIYYQNGMKYWNYTEIKNAIQN